MTLTTRFIAGLVYLGILGILITCSQPVLSKANLDTLRLAQVIFRHGAKNIDLTYPSDPYKNESYWKPGYSQLTNLGKLQAYNLGLFLRDRYDGFVKSTYDLKDIYVRSSDVVRTIQTASSILAGFYLPNQILLSANDSLDSYLPSSELEIPLPWKSVPIHTCPIEFDNIIRQQSNICARYYKLFTEAVPRDYEEGRRLHQGVKYIEEYLYNNTGVSLSGIEDVMMNVDSIYTEAYYNVTLPDWAQQLVDSENMTNLFLSYIRMLTYTDEMKRLRVGPLLGTLVNNMLLNDSSLPDDFKRARDGQKKVYFYSGHDLTLGGLLNTLGIFNNRRPPYSATVLMELHQQKEADSTTTSSSSGEQLYVEIYYYNETDKEPFQLELPGCGLRCPLADFVSMTAPLIPTNYEEECLILEETDTLSAGWIVLIVLVVWIILFAVLQFWIRSNCFNFLGSKKRQSTEYSRLT